MHVNARYKTGRQLSMFRVVTKNTIAESNCAHKHTPRVIAGSLRGSNSGRQILFEVLVDELQHVRNRLEYSIPDASVAVWQLGGPLTGR